MEGGRTGILGLRRHDEAQGREERQVPHLSSRVCLFLSARRVVQL